MFIPDQGDIIWLNFDPCSGSEIQKRRPAAVISRRLFNKHCNFAIVAPITSTIKDIALEVVLNDKTVTQGSILIYQLKSVDFTARNAKFIETIPKEVMLELLQKVKIIVS